MRPPLVAMLAIVAAQGCGLVVGFGPDKQLADATGSGGVGGEGGTVGQGGAEDPTPDYFCDPGGGVSWLRTFGDASSDTFERIDAAPDGGVYATGLFHGAIDLGTEAFVSEGGADLFVARFDDLGQTLWAKRYGTNLDDGGNVKPARHPNGLAVIGGAIHPIDLGDAEYVPKGGGAVWVTLLSDEGDPLWTTWIDGPGKTWANRIDVDPTTGDVIVFVAFSSQLQLDLSLVDSKGGNDVAIVRLRSADGAILDSYAFGGPADDWIDGLEVAPDGRIVVVGDTPGPIDFGDGLETTDGHDGYVAVFTAELDLVWARVHAFPGKQHPWEMALAPNGDIVTFGRIYSGSVNFGGEDIFGTDDAYLMRLSGDDGSILDGMVSHGIDEPWSVAVAPDGGVVCAGGYRGALVLGEEYFYSTDGYGDSFVFELSPDFEQVVWRDVVVGSNQSEALTDVFVDEAGDAFVSGSFFDELPVDGCDLRESEGDRDAVLFEHRRGSR